MTYDLNALRAREFPWTERGTNIYLNNASTGPVPARALNAMMAFNALRGEPFRITDADEFDTVQRTRELVARLINAAPTEIACMVNTTYGINVAARSLPLRAGDVVIGYDREFPANVYPWMALERDGIRTVRIPTTAAGLPDEERLMSALDRPEVRVLAISWVQFATGYRSDLVALGRRCRDRGIWFVVDAIQGLGAATLDVKACNVDLLACGGQKWLLSPWGSGFLYVRDELARTLEPHAVGWMSMHASQDFARLTEYEFAYLDDARRFEVITLPFQDFAGFNASLALLHELGPAEVEGRVNALADVIVDWAALRDDVRLVTPADRAHRAGIVVLVPPDPAAASERLNRAQIAHAVREGGIRLSPHGYNTKDEVQRALAMMVGEDD
ncbi:MAG TPA: aminotransferase class V-fold PLP-dependent enzyme [Gemmatimonadaceae bacterium]|jgi:selenocysteine lyase/cysteine desulfurase